MKEGVHSGLEISEQAVALLRRTPLHLWVTYYLGTIPFVLLFVTFWSETAYGYSLVGWRNQIALALAVAYIFMKYFQARFAQSLLVTLENRSIQPIARQHSFAIFVNQAWLHATGIIALPLAALFVFPFGWVNAFYQNLSVLDDGKFENSRALVRAAVDEARRWPKQNHFVIWLLTPHSLLLAGLTFLFLYPLMGAYVPEALGLHVGFLLSIVLFLMLPAMPVGAVVYYNLQIGVLFILMLLKSFLNVEHQLLNALNTSNQSLVLLMLAATYLCLDPAIKAAYAVRCFYGRTQHTGGDLRVRFQLLQKGSTIAKALLLSLSILLCSQALAQDTAQPGIERLDSAIDVELEHPRYIWQAPEATDIEDLGLLGRFLQTVADWVKSAFKWIGETIVDIIEWVWDRGRNDSSSSTGWGGLATITSLSFLLKLLVVILIGTIIYLAIQYFREKPLQADEVIALSAPAPDLEEESTTADQLPRDGWLALAQELAAAGNTRLAMRAYFLASLAMLGEANFIGIALFKSNQDYYRELHRRIQSQPELCTLYRDSMHHYEAVWYGDHTPTLQHLERLKNNQQEMQHHAAQ